MYIDGILNNFLSNKLLKYVLPVNNESEMNEIHMTDSTQVTPIFLHLTFYSIINTWDFFPKTIMLLRYNNQNFVKVFGGVFLV